MRIVWTEAATSDLDGLQGFLDERSPQASRRIWRRITDRVARLTLFPYAAPAAGIGDLRRLVVGGTPYLVFYRVVGDDLIVESVLHAVQDK